MNECAKQLAYLIRRGHNPLHPDQRSLLRLTFPIDLDEYKQVICDASGTHMMAWGYMNMPGQKKAVIVTWTTDSDAEHANGYAQHENVLEFKFKGYHSWLYRKYVHAVRRILYAYDHLRGRHA